MDSFTVKGKGIKHSGWRMTLAGLWLWLCCHVIRPSAVDMGHVSFAALMTCCEAWWLIESLLECSPDTCLSNNAPSIY